MKSKGQETSFGQTAIKQPPQPTIWALRKNVRAHQDNTPASTSGNTLYEHLFGYDPIRLLGPAGAALATRPESSPVTADNPKLNIIHSQTNFLVMEMASDEPQES